MLSKMELVRVERAGTSCEDVSMLNKMELVRVGRAGAHSEAKATSTVMPPSSKKAMPRESVGCSPSSSST